MTDLNIRIEGRAGHITLNRPKALNALTHDQCLRTERALLDWRDDPKVDLVILDGAGDRAFCSGGDIAQVYAAGIAGDYAMGRNFWRDEYRMNLLMSRYPKPVVSFMQGFVMGGGVGYGCHVSHRIVGETTQMAMPECGIGLVPDVGGSYLLGRAPGNLGLYLGTTAARMGPGDAVHAGFADRFIPESDWVTVKSGLIETGDIGALPVHPAPVSVLAAQAGAINRLFGADSIAAIMARLDADGSDLALAALKAMRRNSPLSMACTLAMLRPAPATLLDGLKQEYRATWRAIEQGDFLEGIRAQIIDKDRNPAWKHPGPDAVGAADTAAILAPLGVDELDIGG